MSIHLFPVMHLYALQYQVPLIAKYSLEVVEVPLAMSMRVPC